MRSGVWSHRNPAFFSRSNQQKGQLMSWMLRPACGETQQILDSIEVPNVSGLKRWKVSFGLVVKERYICYEYQDILYKYDVNDQVEMQPGCFMMFALVSWIWLYTSGELLGCRRTMRSTCSAVLMNQSGLHLLALMVLFSQVFCQAVPKKSPTNLVFRCPPSNPLGVFLLYRCLAHHFLHVSRTACFSKQVGVPSTKPRRFPTSSEKNEDFFLLILEKSSDQLWVMSKHVAQGQQRLRTMQFTIPAICPSLGSESKSDCCGRRDHVTWSQLQHSILWWNCWYLMKTVGHHTFKGMNMNRHNSEKRVRLFLIVHALYAFFPCSFHHDLVQIFQSRQIIDLV